MALYNLSTSALIANPTDAQIQSGVDFRNSCATQRPDIYGDPTYTLAQAKADIAGQTVAFYQGTGGLRGYVILNKQDYVDVDAGSHTAAWRIGDLVVDPALFNATTLRTVMNFIKAWVQAHDVAVLRVVGEVNDDSPVWTQYMGPRGYRVLYARPDPTQANPSRQLLMIDRVFAGTDG